jgi:hypothetical protein
MDKLLNVEQKKVSLGGGRVGHWHAGTFGSPLPWESLFFISPVQSVGQSWITFPCQPPPQTDK